MSHISQLGQYYFVGTYLSGHCKILLTKEKLKLFSFVVIQSLWMPELL